MMFIGWMAAGYQFMCAILGDGGVKCFGKNTYGSLGLGKLIAEVYNPSLTTYVNLGGRRATAISCGTYHACVILDDDTLRCWGRNSYGETGRPTTLSNIGSRSYDMGANLTAVDLGGGARAVAVACGGYFTCAILDTTEMKCWGYNQYGMLGLGDTANRPGSPSTLPGLVFGGGGRYPVAIQTFETAVCAILNTQELVCWGSNSWANLGLEDTNHKATTTLSANGLYDFKVALGTGKGVKAPNQTFVPLPPYPPPASPSPPTPPSPPAQPLLASATPGNGTSAVVALGYTLTCVIRNDSSVVCWGECNHDACQKVVRGGAGACVAGAACFMLLGIGMAEHWPSRPLYAISG